MTNLLKIYFALNSLPVCTNKAEGGVDLIKIPSIIHWTHKSKALRLIHYTYIIVRPPCKERVITAC